MRSPIAPLPVIPFHHHALKAAAESPFLDGKVSCCTAALCVLLLPPSLMDARLLQDLMLDPTGLNDNQREYALRSAIQVTIRRTECEFMYSLCTPS